MSFPNTVITSICPECGKAIEVILEHGTLPVGLPLRRDPSPAWRGHVKCLRCEIDMSFEAQYTRETKFEEATIGGK